MREPRPLAEEIRWRIEHANAEPETIKKNFRSSWSGLYRYMDTDYHNRSEKKLEQLADALDAQLTYALEPFEGIDVQALAESRQENRDYIPLWLRRAQRAELEEALKLAEAPTVHRERFLGWYLGECSLLFPGDKQESPVYLYYLLAWLRPEDGRRQFDMTGSGLPDNGVVYEEGGSSMTFDLGATKRWEILVPSASGVAYREWQPDIDLCYFEVETAQLLIEQGRASHYLVSTEGRPVASLKGFLDFLEGVMQTRKWWGND